MSQDLIIGTWRLVSFEYKAEDETSFFPYGKDANGIIYYDKEGYMSAIISRTDRPSLSAEDYIKISDNEKIELSKGFMAYSGKYEILTDKIVHYVEISYIPNWIGTTLDRFYTFKNGHLILSTPPVNLRGKQFVGYVTWAKK